MYKLIENVSVQNPTGLPPQRKLFRLKSGPYTGRLVLLYAKSPGEIVLRWTDNPYGNWTTPQTIISDSSDYPFSAVIDSDGHIYIAYTKQTVLSAVYMKLTFSAGNWVAGTPATICNSGPCHYPAIARLSANEMWCAYSYYNSGLGVYSIRSKVSYDLGVTWGSGPADSGQQISEPASDMPYVCLIQVGANLFAVYSQARSNLYFRRRIGPAGDWENAVHIATADYIDYNFDCGSSPDQKLGIAFCPSLTNRIYFREYDGVALSGLQEAARYQGRSPQVAYLVNKVHVFFARSAGGGFWIPACAIKDGADFSVDDISQGVGLFAKVILYDESVPAHFVDKTTEAADESPADVYHPNTYALLSSVGDCLYLGNADKFFCAAIVLSTTGSGGSVVWEYFDGGDWIGFTPVSGAYQFNQINQLVIFWDDTESVPPTWQACAVNSEYMYWVRARTVNQFTRPPVGTQILAAAPVNQFVKASEAA
jgi:hypothetical protein